MRAVVATLVLLVLFGAESAGFGHPVFDPSDAQTERWIRDGSRWTSNFTPRRMGGSRGRYSRGTSDAEARIATQEEIARLRRERAIYIPGISRWVWYSSGFDVVSVTPGTKLSRVVAYTPQFLATAAGWLAGKHNWYQKRGDSFLYEVLDYRRPAFRLGITYFAKKGKLAHAMGQLYHLWVGDRSYIADFVDDLTVPDELAPHLGPMLGMVGLHPDSNEEFHPYMVQQLVSFSFDRPSGGKLIPVGTKEVQLEITGEQASYWIAISLEPDETYIEIDP